MRLSKCPICRKSAKLVDTIYKNDFGRHIIRCECMDINMRGHNKPDLMASWRRWTKCVRALELEKKGYIQSSYEAEKRGLPPKKVE